MEKDFGKQLAVHQSKKTTFIGLIIAAVAFLVVFGLVGWYLRNNPIDAEDEIMAFVAFGVAVVIPAVLLAWAIFSRGSVTIYEEGVVVKKGKREERFHFSEIAGLVDMSVGENGGFVVPVAGGFIGGAIALGVISAVASNVADSRRRIYRKRDISLVVGKTGGKDIAGTYLARENKRFVSVINTGGDELSEIYTAWLVKHKSITKEALKSLSLQFSPQLELVNGVFVHTSRNDEVRLALENITRLDVDEDNLRFYGLNENGKEKCLIKTKIAIVVHNLDLLFYIVEIASAEDD